MYLNKATVLGNLTRDPEMKALPSGSNVTSLGVATNRKFKDRDGNWQEAVEYHNVIVFGAQAEPCSKFLMKGSQVLVEGRIQTRSWEKDGQKQYKTEIIADQVTFGNKPKEEKPKEPAKVPNTSVDYPEEDVNPEDIPF